MRHSQRPRSTPTDRRRPRTRRAVRTALAAVAALCLLVTGLPPAAEHPVRAADGGARRVIVSFEGSAALDGWRATDDAGAQVAGVAAAREAAGQQRAQVLREAARRRIDVRPVREFGLLVNAVAAEVDAADVERLRALPGVAAVHPDRRFSTLLDVSVPLVGAPALWEGDGAARPPVTGEGRIVAVLDTGIDYTHPALGGGIGPGYKVVDGHNFHDVGDDDPIDRHGHGTHVAGIIAGQGAVTGVAPGASLTAYKVLGDHGSGQESSIIAALEHAADPANPYRADVINMSLGAFAGDEPGPLDEAARLAAESGVVVVAAAGNAGPFDGSVSSPALADGVIAVGASISGVRPPRIEVVEPDAVALEAWQTSWSANAPEEPILAEVVDVGDGQPWDYDGIDVTGKAVLVRGPAEHSLGAVLTAKDRGAVAAMFSFRTNTPVAPGAATAGGTGIDGGGHDFPHRDKRLPGDDGPGTRALPDDGRFESFVSVDLPTTSYGAVARRLAEGPVVVRIGGYDATDEIARFSSRGPGRDFALKPEIAAPGANVLSTVPQALHAAGTYRFSGTSMAAPHVAGAAALLGEGQPTWSARQVSAALIGSAVPVDGWSPLAQGAGRLDAVRAATTTLLAEPPTLALGVTSSGDPLEFTSEVTLSNPTGHAVTVALRPEPRTGTPDVEVEPATLTLDPGADTSVTVTVVAAPEGRDTDHTGWIVADVGDGAALHVPYTAFERRLVVHVHDPAFDTTEAFVYSPARLAAPPQLTVTGPGHEATVEAEHDHGRWWRARLPLGDPGAHQVQVAAVPRPSAGHGTLRGETAFEVLAAHQRLRGASGWVPVGPDSDGGVMAATGHRGMAVATEGPANLFLTSDEGRTWRQHTDLPVAAADHGIVAADPDDPDRLYYGVSGGLSDETYRGRVLTSTDRGLTWSLLPFPDTAVNGLQVAPGGLVVVLAEDGVHTSTDRGATWSHVPAPWLPHEGDHAALLDGDLYVATFSGLWAVRDVADDGAVAELVWQAPGFIPWVASVAAGGGWLFATAVDGWVSTVYRSSDGGRTMEPLVETEGGLQRLEVAGTTVIATGSDALLWGSDYGRRWTERDGPLEFGTLMTGSAAWAEPGRSGTAPGRAGKPRDVLIGAHSAGVYVAGGPDDGWRRIGVQGATVRELATSTGEDGEELLLAGTPVGLYRTPVPTSGVTPAVRDWGAADGEGAMGRDIVLLARSPEAGGVLYRVVNDALFGLTIERSDDAGLTWHYQHGEGGSGLALLLHPDDPRRVWVSFAIPDLTGLLVTSDGGATWGIHYQDEPVVAIAADPRDADRIWLGRASGLYRSDDGGATSRLVLPGPVASLHTDPRVPDRLVVGGDGLRVSEDGGETFEAAEHARVPMRVSALVAAPDDPDRLFAAAESHYTPNNLYQNGRGVLASRDGGRTWSNLSDSLQNRSVTSLTLSGDGRYLFAGTTSGGVHRLRVP